MSTPIDLDDAVLKALRSGAAVSDLFILVHTDDPIEGPVITRLGAFPIHRSKYMIQDARFLVNKKALGLDKYVICNDLQ